MNVNFDDAKALDTLGHTLHKRVVEAYVASLAADRADVSTFVEKHAALDAAYKACEAVMVEVNAFLATRVSIGAAAYFLRERAFEPGRPQLSGKPLGAWINAMWHRCDRLTEILREVEPR